MSAVPIRRAHFNLTWFLIAFAEQYREDHIHESVFNFSRQIASHEL